jgi:hypothetical protein
MYSNVASRYQRRGSITVAIDATLPPLSLSLSLSFDMGSETNGKIEEGFEIPEINIKFTQLFINGRFVDALSGSILSTFVSLNLFPSVLCLVEVAMSCIIAAVLLSSFTGIN